MKDVNFLSHKIKDTLSDLGIVFFTDDLINVFYQIDDLLALKCYISLCKYTFESYDWNCSSRHTIITDIYGEVYFRELSKEAGDALRLKVTAALKYLEQGGFIWSATFEVEVEDDEEIGDLAWNKLYVLDIPEFKQLKDQYSRGETTESDFITG